MKEYTIVRADGDVSLDGSVEGTRWEMAAEATIDTYPWNDPGPPVGTTVRALYDDEAVYLQYHVLDREIFANATDLNGPVWEDSCVEFFAMPEPDQGSHYFNFEANCVGTVLLGFGPDRGDRELITAHEAESINVRTSVDGPTKTVSGNDKSWWLAAEIPFETLSAFMDVDVQPDGGTVWQGNFYRLGGQRTRLYGTWNPVNAPDPDFHRPSDFGRVVFK